MKRIMFVCHSNVCRSPVAKYVLLDKLKKLGKEESFFVDSAACTNDDIGRPIYPDSRKTLIEHNIIDGIEEHKAKKLLFDHYDKFDLFIGMDDENMRDMKVIFKGDPDKKAHKIKEFIGSTDDVIDPYKPEEFIAAYNDIDKCLDELIKAYE